MASELSIPLTALLEMVERFERGEVAVEVL